MKRAKKKTFGQILHRCMLRWLVTVLLVIFLMGPDACSVREWAQFAEFWMWITLIFAVVAYILDEISNRKKL